MFFKKKHKEVRETCFHEYRIVDYNSYVDSSFAIEKRYELGCVKCGTTRNVDEYVFEEMKGIGLVTL